MKVSITQPTLFPWIGYFNLIKSSDIFVFLDNVNFQKQSWQMRNRTKSRSNLLDPEMWIRIPTKSAKQNTLIKDVIINYSDDWKYKHLNTFLVNYGKKYESIEFIQELYLKDFDRLSEFNIEFISKCCEYLEIETKLVRSSELDVRGKKSHLILDICKKLNASELIANEGSRAYLEKDRKLFELEEIDITYHFFKHPRYNQNGGKFIEYLSILDLLFSEYQNSKNFI